MFSKTPQIRQKMPPKCPANTKVVWQPWNMHPLNKLMKDLMTKLEMAPEDDVKFQALKEISENMEQLFSMDAHSFTSLMQDLIPIFVDLLNGTTPQFIAENNTLQLRKLILELLYRLSSNEIMRTYSKTWQQILLRLIHSENEENALLIIKILTDHIKAFRPPFSNDLTAFFVQWKNAYNEMMNVHMAANDGATMFLQRNLTFINKSIKDSDTVVDALKTCYFTTPLSYSPQQPTQNSPIAFDKYTLIPRASQSVKVLAEITFLLLVLIQFHRQQLLGELLDLVPIFVRYINMDIGKVVCDDKTYHRELVDEFRNSQVRALSIIAYTARQAQMTEVMNAHSHAICQGILMLFDTFHDEVISLRRDLLLAIKYFFQSEFRNQFIPVIPKMCDEKTLLGNSFTSQDQLRNQAYSLLADILHHVRMNLGDLLMQMFFLCSRNLHDPQLLPYVQTMYGKLMMNLIEPLMMQAKEGGDSGELLGKMQRQILCNSIDTFVRKAQQISEWHLPNLMDKYRQQSQQQNAPQIITTTSSSTNEQQSKNLLATPMKPQQKSASNLVEISAASSSSPTKLPTTAENGQKVNAATSTQSAFDASQAYWQDPLFPLSLADCKNMVRFIILPTKMLVIALKELGNQLGESNSLGMVEDQLSQLFSAGLKCLDIFNIGTNTGGFHGQNAGSYSQKFNVGSANVRTKEEKDTIEAFMNIFTNIDVGMFEKIVEKHIDLLMERMILNPVLQNVCNQFFSHPQTMRKMGVILVKYLLGKLPELGANNDRAVLYLKMFKLIFHTLSYTPNTSNAEQIQTLSQNCDIILKPFLHRIVQDSMQLAVSTRESTNYFLLLRSLFRSIGSGAHDHLYQQFLPLLPSILQKLNCLQNGSHRQPIHELFVELCLTVPVRLSTLLPYLPMLMDPLVCALNGSPTLVQQGLRTLELCVDNLQPDYFYEQMQPVRAALMKGLWRCVSTGESQFALIAIRILGKFGNTSRKVLMDAQTMECRLIKRDQGKGPKLLAAFPSTMKLEVEEENTQMVERMSLGDAEEMMATVVEKSMGYVNANLPLDGCVQSAIAILRTSSPSDTSPQQSSASAAASSHSGSAKLQACEFIKTLLVGLIPTSQMCSESALAVAKLIQTEGTTFSNYICADSASRQTIISALNGLFIAVFNMETRQQILPFFRALIKHLTIQCVLETAAEDFAAQEDKEVVHLDSLVLIDAIALTLSDACKDYCHAAILALRLLIDAASSLFNNNWVKAAQMPLFTYMVEKMTALCYRREFFARLGGCTAMRLIIEYYPPCFVRRNVLIFLDGCIHVISCLSGELSSGTFDFASKSIDLIINFCFAPNEPCSQNTLIAQFVAHLINQIDDPETIMRNECIRIINLLAKRTELSLAKILQTSKNILESKLLEGMRHFPTISIQCKIAIIDLYLFCANIGDLDLNIPKENNAIFARNLLKICQQTNDADLKQLLKIQSNGNANGMDFGKDGNSMEIEEKLKTIRKASTGSLVQLYLHISAQYGIGKSDPVLQQIFQYFVDFSLANCDNNDNDEASEEITILKKIVDSGITKILKEFPNNFKIRFYINNEFNELVLNNYYQKKETFISNSFFKKLTLLIKYSSREISENVIKQLKKDLSLIMQTLPASLNSDDIECVVNAMQLFHQSKHYKDQTLVEEFWQFFTQRIAEFPSKQKFHWQQSIVPFLLNCPEILAEIILAKKAFCQQNSAQFVHSIVERGEEAGKLRRALLGSEALLKMVEDELVNLPVESSQPDAAFELNLLKFLATLVDKESTATDMQPHLLPIFASIRSLWTSNSFQQRHSVRNILPPSEQIATEESIKTEEQEQQQPQDSDYDANAMDTSAALPSVPTASGQIETQKTSSSTPSTATTILLDECKFDTPLYCAKILLTRLHILLNNIEEAQKSGEDSEAADECVDLLYELTFAFVHEFASNITVLRKFIDDEIIPKLPLHWRRLCFFKVIRLLREAPANGHSLHLVRFMQYIVAPIFAYAFEIYDVDMVVMGEGNATAFAESEAQSLAEESNQQQLSLDQQNIVAVLCKDVIQRLTNDRTLMSHTLTIVMYLFCALLVQKCPMHIYDPAKKQQGNRQEQGNLRHFMLFGWPCLQQSFRGDMTEKYAGHFLIANIIDQFSINRTIILQVLTSLMQAHHQDNREMIRKSLDILIPAVPRRMADGHSQLQILFKKILVEECRNSPQLIHCLQIIVRHHTVFYHIRHQIAQLILGSMHRLLQMQSSYETKRLMLEICEVFVKWEQERQTALQTTAGEPAGTGGTAAGGNGESNVEQGTSTPSLSSAPSSSTAAAAVPDVPMQPAAADLHKQMDKPFIDNVILFLFRIATSTEMGMSLSSGGTAAMEQINRRAIVQLRNALKPNIFGGVATIRTQLLEKQLQLPNPEQFSAGNEVAINHQLQVVNVTLDLLSGLIHYLAPQTVLELFTPLQRALISCMSYSNSQQILRNTYNILSKLLEKSKSSATGLDEFEQLNQHIGRSIHDAFNSYAGTLTSNPPMTIITLLRLMHSSQPAYLDTVCLTPFIKLLQRLVREYVVVNSHGASTIDQAQKLIGDLLAICLEVLSTRSRYFNGEAQKNVVQFVLLPLIEKNAVDKILENIVKISLEVVKAEIAQNKGEEFAAQQSSQIGIDAPSAPIQSQGGHVLIKLFQAMDQRLVANADLRRQFLNAILILYENQELLTINLSRLQPAFYWGLCTSDRELRNRYFAVFEQQFPKPICARLVHIMSKENWENLGASFWLTHVVHLLLLSTNLEERIRLANCAKFANLIALLAPKGNEGMEEEGAEMEEKMEAEEEMEREELGAAERMETEEAKEEDESRKLSNEQQSLMDEQMDEDGGGEREGGGEEESESPQRRGRGGQQQQPMQLMNLPSVQSGSQQSLLRPNSRDTSMMRISFSEIGGPIDETAASSKKTTLEKNVAEIQNTLISLAKEAKFRKIVTNLMDILHSDSTLCQRVFVELFSSLWMGLTAEERDQITPLVTAFLTSASMCPQQQHQRETSSLLPQKNPSVVACFLEAFIRCTPAIPLEPFVLAYIGANHRCWHLALLHLEQMATGIKSLAGDQSLLNPTNWPEEKLEVLDSLAQLYRQLNELDQFTHCWRRRAFFDKTIKCLTLYQQGDFLRARETAEKLIAQLNEKITGKGLSATELTQQQQSFTTQPLQTEWREIEQCWINSCKQLNDWRAVEKFTGSEEVADAPQLADALWHLNEWRLMKECLVQVDAAADPRTQVKSTLLKLMTNIANFDQQEHRLSKEFTEKSLYDVNRALCREWRRLPSAITHSHVQIMHRAHLALEVQESTNVLLSNLQSLNFPTALGTSAASGVGGQNGAGGLNQDVKKLTKSWKNRSTGFVDQLNCWQAPFTWRCQFFSALLRFYESTDQKAAVSIPHHAIAQTQLEFMRTLRHSNQIDTALGEMNKMHSTSMVHPMDAHSKLVEHIKCLLKLSSGDPGCGSKRAAQDGLVEALDMIEGTQFQLLKREQIAQLMVYKGILLNRLDKREEAGKAFSAAAQLDQVVPGATSASVWKHWGDFLTNMFLINSNATSALSTGMQAIACTLEHARIVGPQKARASIAKLLWLIKIACGSSGSTADKVSAAIDEQLKDSVDVVPPANWIFWLNSIVADIGQRPSSAMLEILRRLGKSYPQQVFCALRLELGPAKVNECLEKFADKQKLLEISAADFGDSARASGEMAPISAENRLISALENLCEHSLSDMDALNRILNELDSFAIGPIERILNEFKQILAQCHFDQFTKIAELTTMSAETAVIKRICASIRGLSREIGVGNSICIELNGDFGFLLGTKIPSKSLHKITSTLRKWIPRLCEHIQQQEIDKAQSQLKLSEFCPQLSRFKSLAAKIDLFDGQCTEPGHPNPQISQFLPIYEQYIQNESVCRLIRIRSLNGKIYSYQLERLRHSNAASSQSHIFQLFTLLNTGFTKSRNTAQRHLQFAIPRIQLTGPNCRLIQCCPAAGISSQFQNANSDHSAENFAIFSDILGEMLNQSEGEDEGICGEKRRREESSLSPLAIVDCYYNRLAEQRYSHKTIHELFNQISASTSGGNEPSSKDKTATNIISVQRDLLTRWMRARYPNPTSLWIARKKMALHFALLGLSEHTFFLSPMMPDGLVLDLSTGQLFFNDYKFDLTTKICETIGGKVQFIELDANRPVPFRLTSNIAHFLAPSIDGHLSGALTAIARSFSARSLEVWLRPILWDVFVKVASEGAKDQQQKGTAPDEMGQMQNIVNPVKRAVDTIISRIKLISHYENGVGPTSNLLIQAQLPDNLCRMDPVYHPWF